MKHIYLLLITLFIGSFGFGQTTATYSFSGGVTGLNEAAPGITVDPNIGFGSFKNSGSSNPALISGQLRLYQNGTKGGSIIIYANNGATITNVTVYASSRTGDAGYTVDGGSATNLSGGSTYTMSSISANTEVEFYQRESGSGNRIYVDSFEVTYTMPATCAAPTTQASAYNTTALGTTSATLNWMSGNGDEVLVLVKEGSAVDTDPEIGTTYTGDTTFSSGDQIGTGNYAVYSGSTISSIGVTGLTPATTYHIAVYEYNTTDTCYELTELTGNFTTADITKVQFTSTSASVAESAGTYDLVIEIANEDVAATTFDVVLTSGDASDIDSYTTQSKTFPGSSTTDITVTITVTDDAIIETDEVFTFEIQNVAGGNSAAAGTNNAFDLTITNNDFPTTVEFISSSDSVSEGVGTYDLEFTIANENATATSFEVVLTGGDGDAADIDGYTTQTVTFPSGSAINQVVTLTVTDDTLLEANETLTFEIQNVTGGSSAVVGSNNSFTLTLTNNDVAPPTSLPYSEDFSDCGTAEWFTYDEAGSNSWSCGSGEYTMNGFPSTNDIDWLISDFTIDFDSYASVNIEVTTSEQYGNAINEAGEFELVYSTDYSGSGDPSIATWTALTFDPNNTSTGSGPSSNDTTVIDASSITGIAYIAFVYDASNSSGGAEEWNITNILIEEIATSTSVEFVSNSATVAEDAGTYALEFSILNEDLINATTFDVVLISGDNADIDGYTTQTVTFAGGTSTNQTVTITVTDDLIDEGDETLTFEIQNVSGGDSAAVGSIDSFDLTISVSDTPIPTAGWQIISENTPFVIDFDTTVTDVNNGAFDASGFTPSPTSGQLDADAWASTGMSEGNMDFGDTKTSGDYAKGTSPGGITSGGFYAFDTGSGNSTLGFQATGSDFTPGTITLRAQNQTGNIVTAADLAYLIYVDNNEGRSTSLNFSYSTDDFSYTDVTALDYTSDTSSDASDWVPESKATSITGLSIANGEYLYLRWSSADSGGSGSRDEFALDDISLNFNPIAPTTYTYNGTWSPSDPTGVATASDNIIIASGDVTMTTDITANTVTVNPGASLTINTGITLTATTVTLESASDSFSSLISDGTISGTVSYERFVNTLSTGTGGNDLISLPLMPTGLTFDTFITNGDNATEITDNGTFYAFAPYNNTNVAYENFLMSATDVLLKAKGYRAATDSGDLLTFSGAPETNNVTIEIDTPSFGSQWNLIGNPYPSYVDADLFLSVANTALLDASAVAIYAYNSGIYPGAAPTTNNFTIINKATIASLTGENFNIAPGQGFFVASNATGGFIEFTPAMRTLSGDDDYIAGRNSNESNYFKLNLIGSSTYSTSIFFNTNASLGLDPGYDAVVYGENSENYPIFTHLVEENMGRSMAIQSLDNDDLANVTIPLGVNANQGEAITFSINSSNLSSTTLVYLEDNVTNTFTLLNSGDYTLTPSMNLSGTGRFYLRVSNSTLSIIDNTLDQLSIYTNKADKTIVIAGQLLEPTSASVYDVQGRLVSTTLLQTTVRLQAIDVSNLSHGIYVVQLYNAAQNKTQKVVLR